jgi:hypothetical protein
MFFVILVLILSVNGSAVRGDEPVVFLRMRSFNVPKEVSPSSIFPATLDVEYALHTRLPANATIRAAIYLGDINFSNPVWQSDPVIVMAGGDEIWHANLTSPPTEGYLRLTAYAYYLDEGGWRFYNDTSIGQSFMQATIEIGKTASLDIALGVVGLPVTIDNSTVITSPTGHAETMLFLGGTYLISVPPVVKFQNATRIIFTGWSDGNKQTDRPIVINGDAKLVGSYKTQFALQIYSGGVLRIEWYDAGANAELQSPSPVPMNWPFTLFGLRDNFVRWTGDVNSTLSQVNVTMNSPKTVYAVFSPDYRPLILAAILVAGAVCSLVLLIARRRSSAEDIAGDFKSTDQLTALPCRRCGEPTEKEWAYCIHCGSDLRNAWPSMHEDAKD